MNVIATRRWPRCLNASAAPVTTGTRSPSIETSGKTPRAGAPKCMLPSRPSVGPVALAEEIAEHVGGRRAASEMAGELAVERRDDVVATQGEAGACCDRLLAAARVHRARQSGPGDRAPAPGPRAGAGAASAGTTRPLVEVDRRYFGTWLDRHQKASSSSRAAAVVSADGRYASSSSGANGTGVSGGAWSAGGASSRSKDRRAIRERITPGGPGRAGRFLQHEHA